MMKRIRSFAFFLFLFGTCLSCFMSVSVTAKKKAYKELSFDENWKYASFSKIHDGKARLYRSTAKTPKNIVVCVNAGHGTKGGEEVKTQCHPDGSPKIVSGTTKAGQTEAFAVSSGMSFSDGTPESTVTLSLAKLVKKKLLEDGYDVLMIREEDDIQLDNIARSVFANVYADCHVALHYDSTSDNKGAFFLSVPEDKAYRSMEPVRSFYTAHLDFGHSLIEGLEKKDVKIFNEGAMPMDLTQTSYSKVPSVDIEVGDAGSDYSEAAQTKIADGILEGLHIYFEKESE